MVCIIDDREDVWNFSPNLIHVKPYRFFQGTADINAPPGLDKTEHDKEPLTHKVHVVSRSNSKEDSSEKTEDQGSKAAENESKCGENTEEIQGSKTGETGEPSPEAADSESKSRENAGEKSDKENKERETDVTVDSQSIKAKEEEPDVPVESGSSTEGNKTKEEPDVPVESGSSTKGNKTKEEDSEKEIKSEEIKDNEESEQTEKSDLEKKEEIKTEAKCEKVDAGKNSKDEKNECEGTKDEEMGKEEDAKGEGVEIEWDDDDDYLMYLQDILVTVHKAFYDMYDQLNSKGENAEKPDMKNILPYVKRKVLKGKNLLFSGVFPMNVQLEKSRAFHVAKMLGANIHTDFIPRAKDGSNKSDCTTHVVAARLGTVKVRMAQKHKHVKLVNPQWLWTCAERMQLVDERLYPLNDSTSGNAYCESPDAAHLNRKRKNEEKPESAKRPRKDKDGDMDSAQEKMDVVVEKEKNESEGDSSNVPSAAKITTARFSTSYNPMLAFSDEDLECMDKEVEDLMDEEGDESEEDDIDRNERIRQSVLSSGDDNSSSGDSMTGDFPRGWNFKKRNTSTKSVDSSSDKEEKKDQRDEESENELEKYEKTVAAFAPDSESETQDSFAESIGSVDDEMAEAVEREFLAN